MKNRKTSLPLFTSFASAMALAVSAHAAEQSVMEEIQVTADFREQQADKLPGSLSVIGDYTIEQLNAQHLEQILNQAPNVNFSSGASRARFFQIRGIGERSQFVEPLNPSVGVLIDGLNFTGLGTAATLLDVQQVEVLRGPQGTRFGANALAGLINIKTNDPTEAFEGKLEASVAEYNTHTLGAVLSGSLSGDNTLLGRIAVQQNKSDGYIENDYLNRDNTNNIDEQTLRGKVRWNASDDLTLDTTVFYANIDNGYDAFSLDNTRHTLSDQPGQDRQETFAIGFDATYQVNSAFALEALASFNHSNLEYGYDEDWSYPTLCAGLACDGWEYSSTDDYIRNRDSHTLELRFVSSEDGKLFNDSTDWLVGIYHQQQKEDLQRIYTYQTQDFFSDYETDNNSVYAQLETQLSSQWILTTGLRYEHFASDYADNDNVNFHHSENLWGGQVALSYQITEDTMLYGLVSRGYKAGGVNSKPSLSADQRDYDTEHMINYEVGSKQSLLNNTLQTQLAFFYQDRKDVQAKQSFTAPVSDPFAPGEFIEYLANAAEGNNYGLEAQFQWEPNALWAINGSLGLLRTEFDDYITSGGTDLSGRAQAHAPKYQFNLAATYFFTPQLSGRVEVEGKDEFYFSDSHNEKSDAYELWNASLTYTTKDWKVSLWGRNLLDEDYQVRGFGGFGNDPRKFYATEPYYQYGEPRVIGVSASYSL